MGYDPDLNPILRSATDEELMPLLEYLLRKRSNSLKSDSFYKAFPNEPHLYPDLIADEIRAFGGNSIANFFRREGISYRKVVCNVADKLHVNYNRYSKVSIIEEQIINHVFQEAWDHMTQAERQTIIQNLPSEELYASIATMSAQALLKAGGFTTFQISVIVANAIARLILGHGLSLATNAAITRALGAFLGPIGWVITGIWTAIDLTGPSYKTTIPCVIQVAMIRIAHNCVQRCSDAGNPDQSTPNRNLTLSVPTSNTESSHYSIGDSGNPDQSTPNRNLTSSVRTPNTESSHYSLGDSNDPPQNVQVILSTSDDIHHPLN